MKIVNYSDILRKSAIKTFEDYLDLNDLECSFEYFKKFCTNYKTYIEVMFICSYLHSNYDNFLYDDNESREDYKHFKDIIDMDYYSENLDYNEFLLLYEDTVSFLESSYSERKEFVYELKKDKQTLKKLCPLFIFDMLYYENSYNLDELLSTYSYVYSSLNDKDMAIDTSITENIEIFNYIYQKNPNNFEYLIYELTTDFYRFYKPYAKFESKVDKDILFLLNLIEDDINKLVLVVSGNDLLLSKLMNGYLKYNVSDELESKQITDYFNNPLEKDKLININKKTLKMKGELY